MAYKVPVFPLVCNVWNFPATPPFAASFTCPCNLSLGRRTAAQEQGVFSIQTTAFLLVPPLTDVRDFYCGTGGVDTVEVPAFSGRYYTVLIVDDVAKGFANEYRMLEMMKTFGWGNWPSPIP